MKKIFSIIALLTLVSTAALSQSYTVDPGHTTITSKVVRFDIIPVLGRFTDVSGTINYDPDSIENTKATIIIKTGSYAANNPDGEDAVKSEAFLNVAAYPEMVFEVEKLWEQGGDMMASGSLTLHGMRKEVSFPVSITGPMVDLPTRRQSIGIVGELTINRLDYGVGKTMKMPTGRTIIGNDVVIEFYVLALAD